MEVREPLSRQRALTAAMALADASGLAALTMRRLAADLGVEAMSLYYHLPGKEGLLDGLAETVIAEITTAVGAGRPEADWRASLRLRFLAARNVMLRHPWAPGLLAARPAIPVSLFAYYEEIVATLISGGISHRIAHRALHAFGSLALGFSQEIFSPATAGGAMEPELTEANLAALAEALPNLTAMLASEAHAVTDPTLGWCDSQVEFEFTIDLLLDGIGRTRG